MDNILIYLLLFAIIYIVIYYKKSNETNIEQITVTNVQTDIMGDDFNKCSIVDKWFNKYMNRGKYFNTVEKVNKLFGSSNKQVSRNISDIYDDLTKTPYSCSPKKCLEKGYVDLVSKNELYYNEDRTIKNDMWQYQNECPMNGQKFFSINNSIDVYGYDEAEGLEIGI